MERKHTIVLLQPTNNKATRTYMDYETVTSAMEGKAFEKKKRGKKEKKDIAVSEERRSKFFSLKRLTHAIATPPPPPPLFAGICRMFEKKLKDLNPTLKNITYEISDLYNFIDSYVSSSSFFIIPLYLSFGFAPGANANSLSFLSSA